MPNVCFGVVIAKGVDNKKKIVEVAQFLEAETVAIRQRLEGINLKEYTGVVPYREAFLSLGVNPNKYMSSVEALSKRIMKGNDLPQINTIVDLGNALSLKYMLPMGAHDIGKMDDSLEVRFAKPEDVFVPFGGGEPETPDADELIYVSGNTVKTRRWIWRQSENGKIDEDSKDILFPIDGFLDCNGEAVKAAQSELAELLKSLFGCDVVTGLLTKDNPSISL
ncbi:B3/B4 domain-containing protein [Anaerotignum sp.]|uniref:B3/B4 domain-containing protein n=1 Tax=Anaerotignum sp. TaxID=2039241 RepID=UPI0027150F4C|nr:phenylalanine--tRNA ligase beta subunit-related protein [Anaerotignum sp.]